MSDTYDLNRFVRAQQDDYERALLEITSGQKRTHWMWYIFPQLDGLAHSPTAKHYSIKSVEEAKAYLEHPILGPRLLTCAEAVVSVERRSATEIFGTPDDLKLKSCATLFSASHRRARCSTACSRSTIRARVTPGRTSCWCRRWESNPHGSEPHGS